MKLMQDVSRCAARFDFKLEDTQWCSKKETCQRWLAFRYWDKNNGIEDYQRISVTMGRPDCEEYLKHERA